MRSSFPSPSEEELADVINFDEYLTPNKESSYIMYVKSNSMKDAGIVDGDMVIVERRHNYKPGQIVIAAIDDEFVMKYLRKKNGQYYLESANPTDPPLYPTEKLNIEAVVTAVVRKYET